MFVNESLHNLIKRARVAAEEYETRWASYNTALGVDGVHTQAGSRSGKNVVNAEQNVLNMIEALASGISDINRAIRRAAENLNTIEAGQHEVTDDHKYYLDPARREQETEMNICISARAEAAKTIARLGNALASSPADLPIEADLTRRQLYHSKESTPDNFVLGDIFPEQVDALLNLKDGS